MTLADALAEWTDLDGAMFQLGVLLGVFTAGDFLSNKAVLWSNNPVGNALGEILNTLHRAGLLEYRDDPGLSDYQYRWARREAG